MSVSCATFGAPGPVLFSRAGLTSIAPRTDRLMTSTNATVPSSAFATIAISMDVGGLCADPTVKGDGLHTITNRNVAIAASLRVMFSPGALAAYSLVHHVTAETCSVYAVIRRS